MELAEAEKYNIELLLDDSAPINTRAHQAKLVDRVVDFSASASDLLVETFWQRMGLYQLQNGEIDPRILECLKDKKLDTPYFSIADRPSARAILAEYEFTQIDLSQDSLLLVFNFPRPISKFWWKRQPTTSQTEGICRSVLPAIAWGVFCKPLYQQMTSCVKRAYKDQRPLSLTRINHQADHVPDGYYYLWEVSSTIENCRRRYY